MTSPRTPRAASEVASSSPNIPSVHGEVVVTTSRSPPWHCSTAAWIMRLSPGQHSAVTAGPHAVLDRAQAGPEVPGPADRLVHGGYPELGQLVDHPGVGPGHAGDDH